jgi:CheY-like chemotaxis protein
MSRPARESLSDAIIMMVDDEPTTLDVLEMFLEAAGYENFVSVTDSGRVLELLASRRPDLLVLNLMMPGTGGFEILHAMRADRTLASIPVIVLTSSTDPEIKRSALELGAADFLAKPVDPSELVLRLRNTLAASSHRNGAVSGASARPLASMSARVPVSASRPLVSSLIGDEPRVRRILAQFVARLEKKLAAMDASLRAEDRSSLVALGHWLKGAAGTVGFEAFMGPAEEIRQLASNGTTGEIAAKLRELHELAARIAVDGDANGKYDAPTHEEVDVDVSSRGEER